MCSGHSNNPKCKLLVGYAKENKMWNAEEQEFLCRSCVQLGKKCGENNPFYGKKHTDATRLKMSNHVKTLEHRQKLSDVNKGKTLSSMTREKISNSCKGKIHTDETRKKRSIAMTGKKHTEESKDKMKKPKSEEAKKNMRKPKSLAHRKKLSDSHKGKKLSIKTRNKMSDHWKNMSEQKKKDWIDSISGVNSPNYGKSPSVETRSKISASLRVNYEKHSKNIREGIRKACLDGRISPTSKKGISGRYKGMGFSSSCELSFLINYYNINLLIRADSKGRSEFRIPYVDHKDARRTYFPDYFNSINKILYEIKPIGYEKLPYYDFVKDKIDAAIPFCEERGWNYEVVKVCKLNKVGIVFPMRQRDEITLTPKWEKQYQEWILKKKRSVGKPPEILLSEHTKKIIRTSGKSG